MTEKDPRDVLQQEILSDGRRRAERIIQAARAQADKALADRRAAVEAEVAGVVAEGRRRAERRADMVLRTVDQEVSRRKLAAREALIQEVLEQARKELEGLSGDRYGELAVELAESAIRGMCATDFLVQVVAPDENGLNVNALADRIVSGLAREGRRVSLRAEGLSGGSKGVIVLSADGRLRWDNTIESRLRRLRRQIRARVAPILLEES
jgi:vacuolar-type H+-ATPase subunit E/Vma4